MFTGLGLLAAAIVLRGLAAKNRHIRAKLLVSAAVFAAYAGVAAMLRFGTLDAELRTQLGTVQPLLLIFGLINLPSRSSSIRGVTIGCPIAIRTSSRTRSSFSSSPSPPRVILRDRVLAATAAGAVVLGFALQDTLGNLIAGLAIQIEKPFRVGHWVTLGGQDGLVSEITWRATKIRTKAGNFVIVPNSVLSKDTITNYSEPTLPHARRARGRRELRFAAERRARGDSRRDPRRAAPRARSPIRRAGAGLRRVRHHVSGSRVDDRLQRRSTRARPRPHGDLLHVPPARDHDSVSDPGGAQAGVDRAGRRSRRAGRRAVRGADLQRAHRRAARGAQQDRASGGVWPRRDDRARGRRRAARCSSSPAAKRR